MPDPAPERFLVVVRDRLTREILRTWGPFDESRAENLRADKAHEITYARVVVEETARGGTVS